MMTYFLLGNLEDKNSKSPITVEETINLFFKVFNVLDYLYPLVFTHQYLNLENIFFQYQYFWSIKLTYFNLTNDKPHLKTQSGV